MIHFNPYQKSKRSAGKFLTAILGVVTVVISSMECYHEQLLQLLMFQDVSFFAFDKKKDFV